MATRIKLRRDTAQNWTTNNPILAAGETGFETDTRMVKLGDGSTTWKKLPYAVTGDLQITNTTIASEGAVTLASGSGQQENWIAVIDGSEGVVSDRTGSWSDAVAYDSQGNAFVVGYSYASNTSTNGCWVIKTGVDGQVMWKSYYSEYSSYGAGLTIDKNDDVYVLMDAGPSNGNPTSSDDIVLAKLHGSSGLIAWQRTFNSLGDHDDYGSGLEVDKDNNLFLCGSTQINSGPSLFLLLKIAGHTQTVGQTVYQPGDIIWQQAYAGNLGVSANYYCALAVDFHGDVGLIGNSSTPGPNFVPIFKVSGSDGHILWQTDLAEIVSDNGNNYNFSGVSGTSIAADSQGSFYVALTNNIYSDYYEVVVAKIPNITSGTVTVEWAKTIGYDDYDQATSSVICDSENNVYLTANLFDYTENNTFNLNGRYTLNVSKFSSGGALIWQRNLIEEQSVIYPGSTDGPVYCGQTVAVNDKYVLVAGNGYHVSPAGGFYNQQGWYTAFVAQVDKSGTEFEVNGWRFTDSKLTTKSVTLALDYTNYFGPAINTTATITSVASYVVATENTDVVNTVYVDRSRTKTLKFDKNTLSVSPGGSIDVPREKSGWIGIVGNFDGPEGTNTTNDLYFNGVLNDDEGNTYAVGAWFNDYVYVNQQRYNKPPIIAKIDKDGNQLWIASSTMEYYCQTVDIAVHPVTKNLVVLNTDGNEGFNIYTINPVDGVMIGEPTHVRNADNYYANYGYDRSGDWADYGASNVWAQSLALLSDGTPVVTGYINSERDEYKNVSPVLSGSSTSTNAGILVVPHSIFNRNNFPEENGEWYAASTSTAFQSRFYTGIVYVNRYGYGTSLTPVNITVANSTASDALFWVQIDPASGAYSAHLNSGGLNYSVNDVLKIFGSQVGGSDGINDVLITVTTIDTSTNTILTFATTGTSNNTIVKLDTQTGYDFTRAQPYDVLEETGNDGFVWTPTWGKVIGDTLGSDYLNAVAVDSSDNIIVGGYYSNTGLRPAYNDGENENSILTKMSSTGTVAWTVSLDGYEGYGEVRGIVTDPDNNIYALADQYGYTSVTKLDPNGNMFWYKLFNTYHNSGGDSNMGTGIAIDSDRNIVIGGRCYNQNYNSRPDGSNDMYAIIKLNTEGDVLFQRKLGTHQYNWYTGYDDNMVNSLSIGGDRISVIGYGDQNGNYNGLVASVPLDGTGSGIDGTEGGQGGIYGEFQYQNVEFHVYHSTDRSSSISNNEYPVLPFTPQTRTLDFTTQHAYDTGTNITVYIDGPEGSVYESGKIGTKTVSIYQPTGGSITSVATIKFEDGSVQTTAGGNIIPQTSLEIADQQTRYMIRPQDAGHHIYKRYDWSGDNYILLSIDVNRVLPIGTVINIVSGAAYYTCIDRYRSDVDIGSSPDETDLEIYASAPSFYYNNGTVVTDSGDIDYYNNNSNQGWWLKPWSTAQLLKVEKYKWVLTSNKPLGIGRGF